MAGTPNATLADLFRADIDIETSTLRVALYDNSTAYTFDPDTHTFVSDILDGGTTAQELQGTAGYTGSADRQTLANVTVTADDTDDEGVFDADDVVWSGVESTEDIQGWIIYQQVGGDDSTPGDDRVLVVVDDDMADAPASLPLPTNGSNVRIAFNTEGVATIEVI
jgi:hypothetical protein